MQKQILKFQNEEFGQLGILFIDDKPFFPATECAKLLGYSNPEKAIRDHCKGVNESFTPSGGGKQKTRYIPEGDLYRLIIRSKLPAAERFERWVFESVLPTIRKYGVYAAPEVLSKFVRDPKFAEEVFKQLIEERERTAALLEDIDFLAKQNDELLCVNDELLEINEELVERAKVQEPKAHYCDVILQCKSVVPVSLIAKDYGLSAIRFNKLLHKLRIQYRLGKTWLLYQRYADKGYTQSHTYEAGEWECHVHTYWTQAGRLFLYQFLRKRGILPLIERNSRLNQVASDD